MAVSTSYGGDFKVILDKLLCMLRICFWWHLFTLLLHISDMGLQGRNSAKWPDGSEFWLEVSCCWVIQVYNPTMIVRINQYLLVLAIDVEEKPTNTYRLSFAFNM